MSKKIVVLAAVLSLSLWSASSVVAQQIWTDAPVIAQSKSAQPASSRFLQVRRVVADRAQLIQALSKAPMENAASPAQITLPLPGGGLSSFDVVESPIMSPELASKYPEIKTYKVRSGDGLVSGRLTTGPNSFHAYLSTSIGVALIDPVAGTQDTYNSFYKRDYLSDSNNTFSCGVKSQESEASPVKEFRSLARTSNELQTYRIAIATTGEYSAAVASANATPLDVPNTLAEVMTALSAVNVIYERDLAIRLELVANNDSIIYTNSGADPYSNDSDIDLLFENQSNLDSVIGSANYDIGHVFSTTGGGLAALGVVCNNSAKAQGETGLPNPVGDPFYIDFVAHEIGHQFGANHTFNGTTQSCGGGNRNAATAYEPGSGTSIMAYAGICGAENIQSDSDAAFHGGSIQEIINYSRSGGGNTCDVQTATGNTAPVVSIDPAINNKVIPALTPFTLSGSAIDVDGGDILSYQWDQMDVGMATTSSSLGADLITNALFRSFAPSSSPERTFPRLSKVLAGVTGDIEETLPTQNRSLNFRLTVRDGNGGVDEADVGFVVEGNAGPFTVLQPNTITTLDYMQQQTIKWNKACTDVAPVNCAEVDILLSTDSGNTFPTVLIANTQNDGDELVTFPAIVTSEARVKIACSDNIFLDISNADFSLANGSGIVLPTGAAAESCNTPGVIPPNSGDDVEPNDFTGQAQAVTPPFSVNGSVRDTTDADDFFRFTGRGGIYKFTLSNFGGNDLDLYLLNSSGTGIIDESASLEPTETITATINNGQVRYIVVNGFDTSGNEVSYTLDIQFTPFPGSSGGVVNYWLLVMLLPVFLFRFRKFS